MRIIVLVLALVSLAACSSDKSSDYDQQNLQDIPSDTTPKQAGKCGNSIEVEEVLANQIWCAPDRTVDQLERLEFKLEDCVVSTKMRAGYKEVDQTIPQPAPTPEFVMLEDSGTWKFTGGESRPLHLLYSTMSPEYHELEIGEDRQSVYLTDQAYVPCRPELEPRGSYDKGRVLSYFAFH